MHRSSNKKSFVDTMLPKRFGQNKRLERIHAVVDWEKLAELVNDIYASRTGRPSYPPLVMVKVIMLQQWYGGSDVEMAEALWERFSFRRFAGLSVEDSAPNHSTISRFRKELTKRRLAEPLFKEVTRQLERRGLIMRQGSLLDATLVEAQASRPTKSVDPGTRSEVDPDAAWAQKGGKTHFGYKAHIGVDEGSELIREAALTPANVNDTEVADELVSGDEEAVYADKAYGTKERSKRLKAMGIKDRIMRRGNKHHPVLPYWERKRNRLIAGRRSCVEHVFGTLKRSYGYTRVRYMGLARNTTEFFFKCIAYNLRRADRILAGVQG